MDRKQLNAIVTYIARSFSAAALMIWGVFNISVLVIQFTRRTGDDGNWIVSAIMCAFFGLLPFAIGSWLLYRNVASVNKVDNAKKKT